MKRLLFAFVLLSSLAQATTSVTANLKDLGINVVGTSSFVRFYLRGCRGNQPRVNGSTLIAPSLDNTWFKDFPADSSGLVSGTIYSTRDAAGTGNGEIECGSGIFTSVWYGVVIYNSGKAGPEVKFHARNGVTLDLNSATPITTSPVVIAPAGDTTYCRLDGANGRCVGPYVDVRSCGAKFDGVTDDTAAWASCLASHKTILVPYMGSTCSLVSAPINPNGLADLHVFGLALAGGTGLNPCITWTKNTVTVTSATCSSNVLTVTTSAAHGLIPQEAIVISGNATANTPAATALYGSGFFAGTDDAVQGDDVVFSSADSTHFVVHRACTNGTTAGGSVDGGAVLLPFNTRDSVFEGLHLNLCGTGTTCAIVGVEADGSAGGANILTNNVFRHITVSTGGTTNPKAFRVHRTGSTNGEDQVFENDACFGPYTAFPGPSALLGTGTCFSVYNGTNVRDFQVTGSTASGVGVGVATSGIGWAIRGSSGFSSNYADMEWNGSGTVDSVRGEFEKYLVDMTHAPAIQGPFTLQNSSTGCDQCTAGAINVFGGTGTIINLLGNDFTNAVAMPVFDTTYSVANGGFGLINSWGNKVNASQCLNPTSWGVTGHDSALGGTFECQYGRGGSPFVYAWASGVGSNSSADTGLSRDAAGVVDVGNGAQGDISGSIKAAHITAGTDLKIGSGNLLSSVSGNSGKVAQISGILTSGNTLKSDVNGNVVDTGIPAGGGSGTVTNTGGALTLNKGMFGAGGNDSKVDSLVSTDGSGNVTVASLTTTGTGPDVFTPIVAPATPSASTADVYVDSTSKALAVKNDAGIVSHTVQTKTSVASNYLTAIADDGTVTVARPACADLSNAAASCSTDTTNAANISSGTLPNVRIVALPNANLANASTTVNGQTCTLGSSCTITLSAVNAQTATYQVLAADFSSYKVITVASGTFTITLVASGSQPAAGQYLSIINYGSGVVTVARSGQNINGGVGSYVLESGSATNPSIATVISDGTNYFIGGGFTNPMTTAGDVIYAGTTGLPTRLAAGTSSQVFVGGTTPTWGNVPAAAMPALTGDCTTSAGAVSVTCGSVITRNIANGTSSLTSTAIASGACATTVTTAATGAATTDAIAWAYASFAAPSTDGRLIVSAWATANNVNFARCNPTAGSITPSALTINWKVIR